MFDTVLLGKEKREVSFQRLKIATERQGGLQEKIRGLTISVQRPKKNSSLHRRTTKECKKPPSKANKPDRATINFGVK